jgi:WD40 repeat protein
MEALNYETLNVHLKKFDFCIDNEKSEIITGGDDCVMKVYDLKTKKDKRQIDVNDEIGAILLIPGKLFFSQSNELRMLDNFNSEKIEVNSSILLTKFSTNVKRITYNDDYNTVISCSEDDELHLINLSSLDIFKYKSSHEGSIRDIKTSGDYVISTGCDGYLNIYTFLEDGKVQLNKRFKISQKIAYEKRQQLEVDLTEALNIYAAGSITLRELSLDKIANEGYSPSSIIAVSHKDDISLVKLYKDKVLATCDVKNNISVWDIANKTLLHKIEKYKENIISLKFSAVNGDIYLLFGDDNGNVCMTEKLNYKIENDGEIAQEDLMDIMKDFENEESNKLSKKDLLNLSDIENEDGEMRDKQEIEESNKNLTFRA